MGRKPIDWSALLVQAEELAGLGLNEKEICISIGVSQASLTNQKRKNLALLGALSKGKAFHHAKLARKLQEHIDEGSLKALIFKLKTRYGYRETGIPETEVQEAPRAGGITFIEIDGRVKKKD